MRSFDDGFHRIGSSSSIQRLGHRSGLITPPRSAHSRVSSSESFARMSRASDDGFDSVDVEDLSYWDRVRMKGTPVKEIHKELEEIEYRVKTPIAKSKPNTFASIVKQTPKLADLDISLIEEQLSRNGHEIRQQTPSADQSSQQGLGETKSDTKSQSATPIGMFDSRGIRLNSPLGKFISVPLETLPPLKRQNLGGRNTFPVQASKEAATRTKKVMTGTSFVDVQQDMKEYLNPFPTLSLKDCEDKRSKENATVSRGRIGSSQIEKQPERRVSSFQNRSSSISLQDQSSTLYSRSQFLSMGGLSNILGDTNSQAQSVATISKQKLSQEAAVEAKKEEIAWLYEQETVDLIVVQSRAEIEANAAVLDYDAGIVTNWRSEFIDHKENKIQQLRKQLQTHQDEREEAYHNLALISKAAKILSTNPTLSQQPKIGNSIWKSAKYRLAKDKSSFPSRKTFYQNLLKHVDDFGGLTSEKDEALLMAIKTRMEEGYPINRRLLYDLGKHFGSVLTSEPEYEVIMRYVLSCCHVSSDELDEYVSRVAKSDSHLASRSGLVRSDGGSQDPLSAPAQSVSNQGLLSNDAEITKGAKTVFAESDEECLSVSPAKWLPQHLPSLYD